MRSSFLTLRAGFTGLLFLLSALAACQDKARAPVFTRDRAGTDGTGGQGGQASADEGVGGGPVVVPSPVDECEEPGAPDTSVLCGEQVVPVLLQRPNLYFVVDVSGSMNEVLDAAGTTKLKASQDALIAVTRELGHRIRYGLATYPGADDASATVSGCGPGASMFEMQDGDELRCVEQRGGSVHDAFTRVVNKLEAGGGTPLSGTLGELASTLLQLPGATSIVLMTDGAPNCNPEASCEADACIPNIEGGQLPSGYCDDLFNCCDSEQLSDYDRAFVGVAEAMCVDEDASVEIVAELSAAGIQTYVVGVPGSETYAGLMGKLAEAGGTARGSSVPYYDVRDVEDLQQVLGEIGADVVQTCVVQLEQQPESPQLLNVYFDTKLVLASEVDGWALDGKELTFAGASCEAIEQGEVAQIQLVLGCNTVIK